MESKNRSIRPASRSVKAGGGEPDDLARVDPTPAIKTPRDVFAYVIHEGKVRAPAGAMELIERVK